MESEVTFTTDDLMDELRAFYPQRQERRPGGITTTEYAEAEGITQKMAHVRLYKLWKEGKLTRVWVGDDGHGCHVYYKA